MPYVAVLNYYDTVAQANASVSFAMGIGFAPTDAPFIPGGLIKWAAPTQKISIAAPVDPTTNSDSPSGVVSSETDQGEVDIANFPPNLLSSGPYDFLIQRGVFQGRFAQLYYVPGSLWANRVLCWTSILEQPIIQLNMGGGSPTSYYQFILRDPRAALTANIQPNLYGGTNVNGNGIDGETDLLGTPWPILYGRASNIPGVLVNTSQLIYQLADRPAFVDCVRDGGASIQPGVQRANVASLQANTPAPGTYDWSGATGEGTYVKMGTKPVFTLTFDVYEGATIALRTHAQIWSRFRQDRCFTPSASIDPTAMAACDGLDSAEAGFWWNSQDDQQDALDTILSGFSGYEYLGKTGLWEIAKLELPPSGATPEFIFQFAIAGQPMPANGRPIGDNLTFVRPDYMPDGAPVCEVTVDWGQNYQVMSTTDFAGAAPARLVAKFATQWRTAVATNTAVWNPLTQTGPWINAPAYVMQGGYQVGPDGLTCPGAVAEAARLQQMFGAVRNQLQFDFVGQPGDSPQPGDICAVAMQPYLGTLGQSGGTALFRVLQSGLTLDENGYMPAVVLGLQRLSTDP